jgi:hypothetical protein
MLFFPDAFQENSGRRMLLRANNFLAWISAKQINVARYTFNFYGEES